MSKIAGTGTVPFTEEFAVNALHFFLEKYKMEPEEVQDGMNKQKRERLFQKHKYKIQQGKDGRWRTYLPDSTKSEGRRKVAKKNYEDLVNEIIAYYEEAENKQRVPAKKNYTLTELFPEWLDYKKLKGSPSYIRRIQSDWNTFYKGKEISQMPIKNMTSLYLDKWCHTMIRKYDMTETKFQNMKIILKEGLEYASNEDIAIITKNPMDKVHFDNRIYRKKEKGLPEEEVFTEREQKLLFDEITRRVEKNKKCTTPYMIILNFHLGLRVGELVAIKETDIRNGHIHIQRMETEDFDIDSLTGKTKSLGYKVKNKTKTPAGNRVIPLSQEAVDIIETVKEINRAYGREDDGFLFLNSKNGTRTTTKAVFTYMQNVCKKAGLRQKGNHKIRKTVISRWVENFNIDTARRMAGHESEKTTLRNYCFDQRNIEDILDKFEKVSIKTGVPKSTHQTV